MTEQPGEEEPMHWLEEYLGAEVVDEYVKPTEEDE